jgi:putative DNA primase/helicase
LPSGVGTYRSRAATVNPNLQNLQWAAIGISSGEYPLDGILGKATRPEGAQTRMIGIPVPAGAKGGIFNRVKGSRDERLAICKNLAKQVESAIASNYGVMIPHFYERLTSERSPKLERRIRKIIDRFVSRMKIANEDPWERRFAEKFGIVLAGAIILADFGIAPWTKKRAQLAVARMYKRARAACTSITTATDALLKRLRRNVSSTKRFPFIKKGEPVTADEAGTAWGFVKKMPGVGDVLHIRVSQLQQLVKPPSSLPLVLKELNMKGLVVKAPDGKLTRTGRSATLSPRKMRPV